MTRDEIMKLKKPELRMALAAELNRNEYLKQKRDELYKMQEQVKELQKAYELAMLQVAIEYGGEDHTIVLHKIDLNGWTADVDRDPESGTIMIRAKEALPFEPDGVSILAAKPLFGKANEEGGA